ncbi:helix-turn-helix domain-containing protein [Erwinia amylovora]|uniref:helix-turn-helix domain-containing protein n=1 Tax=Erwinia amylovora TaxID=552 RepID=UPI0015D48C02|nr:helix-turn-helix domain-containing protein [Erwinia amylovora]
MTDFNDIHQARGAEALRATLIPRLNEALYELNYKETVMATPDDINPAPEKIPVPDPVAASQPAANPAVASLPVDEPNVSPAAKPDSAPETRAAGAELTAERADTKAVRNPGNALAKSEEILALSAQGMKAGQIAKELGIGQTSVYRILKSQKAEADAITPSVQEVSNSETAIPAMPGPEQPPAEPQTVSSQASDKAIADPSLPPFSRMLMFRSLHLRWPRLKRSPCRHQPLRRRRQLPQAPMTTTWDFMGRGQNCGIGWLR